MHHISLLTNGDDRTPTRESGVQVESLWREANKKEMNGRVTDSTGLFTGFYPATLPLLTNSSGPDRDEVVDCF